MVMPAGLGVQYFRSTELQMERLIITCPICGRSFVIHRRHYRGHVYCGKACRLIGGKMTACAAHRRHRQSPEGRADHRDAERERRARRRVGDHTSKNLTGMSEDTRIQEVSVVPDEKSRSVPFSSATAMQRSLHAVANHWLSSDGGAQSKNAPLHSRAFILERLAGQACIVCGGRDGRLVRMLDRRPHRDSRGPPGAALYFKAPP